MANKTKCLTDGAIFRIYIKPTGGWKGNALNSPGTTVGAEVFAPFSLDIDEAEAEELETLIHNQLELVLSRYWPRKETNLAFDE